MRQVIFGTAQLTREIRAPDIGLKERFTWIEKVIKQAEHCGCQALVLPEHMFTVGYPFPKRLELAQTTDGPQIRQLQSLAKTYSVILCGSFLERDGNEVYNSALLLEQDGTLAGLYRKVHLTPQWEQKEMRLTAGKVFSVFDTSIGRVGMIICFDIYFPESVRILADAGADVVFLPLMNDGRGTEAWSTVVRARAIDNSINIVASVACPSANYGLSMIVDRFGNVLSRATPNDILTLAAIDLDELPLTTQPTGGFCGQTDPAPLREILRNSRRPDIYQPTKNS